jgi:hypothetical protein
VLRAPWERDGYHHPTSEVVPIPAGGAKFHANVPRWQRVDPLLLRTSDNKPVAKNDATDLSHAVVKCLRHSDILPTTSAALAWVSDVTWVIWQDTKRYRNLQRRPTVLEIMYIVEAAEEGRLQVTVLRDQDGPYNAMIRAVQGYSGPISDRIARADAFESIAEVTVMVHYTSQQVLPDIMGIFGRGLIPGELRAGVAEIPSSPRSTPTRTARFLTSSRSAAPTSPSISMQI